MSAFICDEDTINSIVNSLAYNARFDHAKAAFSRPEAYYHLIPRPQTNDEEYEYIRLAVDLHQLNVDAVNQRYRSDDESEYSPWLSAFRTPAAMHAYKSAQCLLYQCSEGNVPDHPLYKALAEMKNRMAEAVIYGMPDYETAKWGKP